MLESSAAGSGGVDGGKKKKRKEHHAEEADVHLMAHRAARLRVRNVGLSVKGSEECVGWALTFFFLTLSAANATKNMSHHVQVRRGAALLSRQRRQSHLSG